MKIVRLGKPDIAGLLPFNDIAFHYKIAQFLYNASLVVSVQDFVVMEEIILGV